MGCEGKKIDRTPAFTIYCNQKERFLRDKALFLYSPIFMLFDFLFS
jgi:hypothetical protein